MATVAVLGASGFVGSAFVLCAFQQGDLDVKAFIHSSGNAWSLSRHAIPLHQVDILSKSDLGTALQGCTHVVNCTRGSGDVMLQGLRNILECCQQQKIERFVHLSSVAVYDGSFGGEPIIEDYPGRADKKTYGGRKNQQDRLVKTASKNGLSSVVLCPPNISGAWSPFLIQLVQMMQAGSFALVERGDAACSLIDVENLAYAIRLALTCEQADGKRIFVTDQETPSWSEVAASIQSLTNVESPIATLSREDAKLVVQTPPQKKGAILSSVKHIASSDVREALRSDPWFASAETIAKGVAKKFPASWRDRLEQSATSKPKSARPKQSYSSNPIMQQFRNAKYSIDRATEILGYQPIVTMEESQEAFRKWYKTFFGSESGYADLLSVK